jgi:hypothetical protein
VVRIGGGVGGRAKQIQSRRREQILSNSLHCVAANKSQTLNGRTQNTGQVTLATKQRHGPVQSAPINALIVFPGQAHKLHLEQALTSSQLATQFRHGSRPKCVVQLHKQTPRSRRVHQTCLLCLCCAAGGPNNKQTNTDTGMAWQTNTITKATRETAPVVQTERDVCGATFPRVVDGVLNGLVLPNTSTKQSDFDSPTSTFTAATFVSVKTRWLHFCNSAPTVHSVSRDTVVSTTGIQRYNR